LGRLRLRPMSPDEFGPWRAFATDDFATEIQRNLKIPHQVARGKAEKDFITALPGGLGTPGHWIDVVEDAESGERLGILWFGPGFRGEPGTLWLMSIWLEERARGKGLGRELMQLLEREARVLGKTRIELNVFADNAGARSLYESLGFVEMSRQLYKELDA
jgi:ribosomal protein S18 acetylase RimI-like enzyme